MKIKPSNDPGRCAANAQYLIFWIVLATSLKSVTNMPSSNQIYWSTALFLKMEKIIIFSPLS